MTDLFLTDNGAIYCHDHLGYTAKATGRDLSGQPIEVITAADRDYLTSVGLTAKCETCGVN